MKILVPVLAACVLAIPAPDDPAIVKSEFVYEIPPTPQVHASTIAVAQGELVAAWFGGEHEKHPRVGIWFARWEGGKWTTPVEVVDGRQPDGTDLPTWNPVLFTPEGGPLILFYKVGPDPESWWGMYVVSENAGRSWSAPYRLPNGVLGPIKNKPIQLSDGVIVSGSSTEHAGWRVHFERSRDGGATWEVIGPVHDGKTVGAIQPAILRHGGRRLQAIGRSRQNRVFSIESADGGATWGPMRLLDLPNPSSGLDAVTLSDGRHLLVYNHALRGSRWNEGRGVLNVAVSRDGRRWEAALQLEQEAGQEFSYPAVIQAPDGLVHITYTWKRQRIRHVVVDPAKLAPRPISNRVWPE